ncbi:MAG: hypothetical protein OXF88_19315 [Rhodobacteraceae bacterium]|nr:hypothetical protein [Paracoccaceae bacterium]MCY4140204.1 hypothetical protein [Paracoccaceae bacterium]
MITMLSWSDLKEDRTTKTLMQAIEQLGTHLIERDLLVSRSPLGERVIGTPMDTDEDRDERYFLTMRFRDRAQLDASYVYLQQNAEAANEAHLALFITFSSKCYICREDTDPAH